MTTAGLRARVAEARDLWGALDDEASPQNTRSVLVSGMLAEHLARQLAAGAEPGAVVVGDASRLLGAAVAVHVMAGEVGDDERAYVRAADRAGVPVVLVQLWPQDDWTPPYVLTPFVVECRAGEGFPVHEIAGRIVEAVDGAPALAARVPVLRDVTARRLLRDAALRAALLATRSPHHEEVRPLLVREQARLLSQIRTLESDVERRPGTESLAATAGVVYASGFLLREVARRLRGRVPEPLADAVVAAAGTLALAEGFRRVHERAGAVRSGS